MKLFDRLRAEFRARMAVPDVRSAYEDMMAELRRTDFLSHALATGTAFPDFLLPDAQGHLVSRNDLLARGPLVVTFFRGTWCPYCALTFDALREALPRIEALGASLAAVTPETGGRALELRERHGAGFPVLSDVDHGLAMACGVVFRTPEPYRRLLASCGVDLADRQGNAAWLLPVPATFVTDRRGVVRWRFLDLDFTHRAEPDDVVAALAALPPE